MNNSKKEVNKKQVSKYIDFKKFSIGLVVYLIVVFILSLSFIPKNISLKIDQISPATIVSRENAVIQTEEDLKKTNELREQRASLVEDVYVKDDEILKQVKTGLIKFFTQMKAIRAGKKTARERINVRISDINLNLSLKQDTFTRILTSSDDIFASLEALIINVVESVMGVGIKEVNSERTKKLLDKEISKLTLSQKYKNVIEEASEKSIKVNLVYDEKATNALIKKEKELVSPIVTKIRKGQPLIYEGDQVTAKHIEIFKKLGLFGVKPNILGIIGISLFSLILFIILNRFIYFFRNVIYKENKYFILIGLLFTVTLAVAKLSSTLLVLDFIPEPLLFLPLAATVMLISILVDPIIALLCGVILSLLLGLMENFNYELMAFFFITSSISIFVTHKVEKRNDLVSAGFILAFFNFLVMLFLSFIKGQSVFVWIMTISLAGLVNGVVSAMIVLAILPYFENIFNITTNMKLVEIGNPNHPLLRKLLLEAPGTYHHSLMVANLAESASEAAGANPYIARVGGYFHDIGKIKRPNFFVENQIPGENPHSKISPQLSALIILSHSKDGVELGRKYKLPKIILDLIEEHHGTGIVSFFYNKMLKEENEKENNQNGEKKLTEEEKEIFRYEGMNPRTKESGILMLADSVEASIKSLEKPNPMKIEQIIQKTIKEKIDEGQLNNCPLTLKDLKIVKDSFMKTFSGMFHQRVDYTKEEVAQNKKEK